ncbi:MAG: hypothetical protein JEZ07_06180 [Phycisphaerae bacterium]|nr:hypothetical protein [Phycisphaerae bacterium]
MNKKNKFNFVVNIVFVIAIILLCLILYSQNSYKKKDRMKYKHALLHIARAYIEDNGKINDIRVVFGSDCKLVSTKIKPTSKYDVVLHNTNCDGDKLDWVLIILSTTSPKQLTLWNNLIINSDKVNSKKKGEEVNYYTLER